MKTLKNIIYSTLAAGTLAMTQGCSSLNYRDQADLFCDLPHLTKEYVTLDGIARSAPITPTFAELERRKVYNKQNVKTSFWFQPLSNKQSRPEYDVELSGEYIQNEPLITSIKNSGTNGLNITLKDINTGYLSGFLPLIYADPKQVIFK